MALVDEYNKLRADLFKVKAGSCCHATAGSAVNTADATDTSTALSLASALRAALATHFADVCNATTGVGAHGAADVTSALPAETVALDGNLSPFTNGIVAAFAAHAKLGAPTHFGPDVAGLSLDVYPMPSDTRVFRQLNRLKAAVNAHFASALNSSNS